MKKIKKQTFENLLTIEDFKGTVEEVSQRLKDEEQKLLNKGFTNVRMELDVIGDYDYGEFLSLFYGDRIETDEEYQKRLIKEEKQKQRAEAQKLKRFEKKNNKEAQEKELLQKLKAKYEGT